MMKKIFFIFVLKIFFLSSCSYSIDFNDIKINKNIANGVVSLNKTDKLINAKNEDAEKYKLEQQFLLKNKKSKYSKSGNHINGDRFFSQRNNKNPLVFMLATEIFAWSTTFNTINGVLNYISLLNFVFVTEKYFKINKSNFEPMLGLVVRWSPNEFAKIYQHTVSTTKDYGLKEYEGFFGKHAVDFGLRFGAKYKYNKNFGVILHGEFGYGFGGVKLDGINKIPPYTESLLKYRRAFGDKEGFGFRASEKVVDNEKRTFYSKYFNHFMYAGIGIYVDVFSIVRSGLFFRIIQPFNDLLLYDINNKAINCGKPLTMLIGVMFGIALPI